jgi:hypothetical protein
MVHIETVNEVPTLLVNGGRQITVDFRKVGVLMEVIPTIETLRPVGVATLDISRLEVSTVSNFITTRNVDRPVFTRSATQTRVTLAAGETFVIGGLKTRRTFIRRTAFRFWARSRCWDSFSAASRMWSGIWMCSFSSRPTSCRRVRIFCFRTISRINAHWGLRSRRKNDFSCL